MSQRDEQMAPIDLALLEAVTGGTATNEQITEALNQIKSTIDGMKSSSSTNSSQWLQWFIPMLLIARGNSNFSYSGGGFNISGTDNPWGWPPPGHPGGRHRRR